MQPADTHTDSAEKLTSSPPPDTPSGDEELLDPRAMDKLYFSEQPEQGMY